MPKRCKYVVAIPIDRCPCFEGGRILPDRSSQNETLSRLLPRLRREAGAGSRAVSHSVGLCASVHKVITLATLTTVWAHTDKFAIDQSVVSRLFSSCQRRTLVDHMSHARLPSLSKRRGYAGVPLYLKLAKAFTDMSTQATATPQDEELVHSEPAGE